jgi:Protein of unknown function (DUF1302)
MDRRYKSMLVCAYEHLRHLLKTTGFILLIATAAGVTSERLSAAELYDDQGITFRWDTTVRYSAMFRVLPRDRALLADPNSDDGDRNFSPGLVSNRLDVFSQADLDYGAFGLTLSGAGWHDSVYTMRNDNDSPATFNPISVPHDAFTRATRALHAEHIELFDVYGHGSFSIGDIPASFRIGRYSLQWGESVFFADNGIAAGQSPTDELKEFSDPQAKAAETLLPVTQASATFLPRPDIAVDLYYQFEWRKNRLPGSGSYFSDDDILDAGGERYLLSDVAYLTRDRDLDPPSADQLGVALRFNEASFNYGFYALRFDAKNPQVYLRPDGSSGPGNVGTYQLVYPRGIELYGASFSSYVGDNNVAGEISFRRNMPLVSVPIVVPSGVSADASDHALYAVGNTLHAQVSSVSDFAASKYWDSAELTAELAGSDVLDFTKNRAAFDPTRSSASLSFEAYFEPQYFEVLPNLDISLPIGVGIGLIGNSATSDEVYGGKGDIEVGLEAKFRNVWEGRLSIAHFLGPPAEQTLSDRDFISLSIQRTF